MRTDDDTWEINTSVGITAIGVAAMRAVESGRPDAVFHDPYAEILVAETDSPFSRMLAQHLSGHGADGAASAVGAGADGDESASAALQARLRHGLGGFMVARTWFFDDYFRRATESGIRQVVILGSGLDARAYRLDWPADTVVYELDQPEVLAFKAGALARHGAQPTADRREVAIDLRRDWPTALQAAGFDPSARTAWLAEGLLRYLPADGLVRLLENIAALSAPGSVLAANYSTLTAMQEQAERTEQFRGYAALGIEFTPGDLWYAEDHRVDPEAWLAERDWAPTHVTCVDVLERLHRDVPEQIRDTVERHRLLTATAPTAAAAATA